MKVIIVETGTTDIDMEMREELLAWARGLGLDTKIATTRFVLAEEPAGYWRAHFSLKRQVDGHDCILPGTSRVAVDYDKFVAIAPLNNVPRWCPAVDEVPEMPIAVLLEALDVAADARLQLGFAARRNNRMAAYL